MKSYWMQAAALVAAGTFAGDGQAQEIPEQLARQLAAADPAEGERVFRQCKSCHTVESGGANRVGPNLYGVVDRALASVEGFRYSPAMQAFEGTWTLERLDAFLADPRGTIPGNRMSFRGLSDATDRAHVIAYLNANSDAPVDLGAAAAAGAAGAAASTDMAAADTAEAPEFGQLVVAPGVEETYYACVACHSEMIVAQQGKTREGWDKLFDWMVEEQGMAELPEDDREIILDYLAAHYNTDRPNFPRR